MPNRFKTKLQEINEKREELEQILKKEAQPIVVETIRDFLSRSPEVSEVVWEQYTPYFNDGEACVFRLYEPRLRFVSAEAARNALDHDSTHTDDGEYDRQVGKWIPKETRELTDAEIMESGGEYRDGSFSSYDLKDGVLDKSFSSLQRELFSGNEDLFEAAFGDHTRVVVSMTDIETDEVDHD